jgi:hypothetical protein
MGYKKIEPNVWKPEKAGDAIEGVLIKTEPSNSYENQVYSIETSDGAQMIVFGTAVLDNRMSYVKANQKVKIVFKGIEKNKRDQDMKVFEVFADDGQ